MVEGGEGDVAGVVIAPRVGYRCKRGHVYWVSPLNSTPLEFVFSGLGPTSFEVREARSGPPCPYCVTELLREKCGASRVEDP